MEQGLGQHLQSTVNMFPLGIYRGDERKERDEESPRICWEGGKGGGGQRNHTQELAIQTLGCPQGGGLYYFKEAWRSVRGVLPSPCISEVHSVRLSRNNCMISVESL